MELLPLEPLPLYLRIVRRSVHVSLQGMPGHHRHADSGVRGVNTFIDDHFAQAGGARGGLGVRLRGCPSIATIAKAATRTRLQVLKRHARVTPTRRGSRCRERGLTSSLSRFGWRSIASIWLSWRCASSFSFGSLTSVEAGD